MFQVPFRKTLEIACEAKGADLSRLPLLIGEDPESFFRFISRENGPPHSSIKKLCDYFEVTSDSLISGFIDVNWIKAQTLPSRYLFSRGSCIRTSLPALEYARKVYGEPFFHFILRTLRIPRELLQNPDHLVSINLLSDILALLAERGLRMDEFKEIGLSSTSLRHNAQIGTHFERLPSPKKVLEKLFYETISCYERNFDYRIIKSSPYDMNVRVSAKPERVQDFKSHVIDNIFVSTYRQGACAAHLKFAGFEAARTESVSCLHRGDRYEEFKLSWA